MEIWGEWLWGETVSEKFKLTYAGQPSLFEGKTILSKGGSGVKFQVVGADQAGNSGQHTLSFRIAP